MIYKYAHIILDITKTYISNIFAFFSGKFIILPKIHTHCKGIGISLSLWEHLRVLSSKQNQLNKQDSIGANRLVTFSKYWISHLSTRWNNILVTKARQNWPVQYQHYFITTYSPPPIIQIPLERIFEWSECQSTFAVLNI